MNRYVVPAFEPRISPYRYIVREGDTHESIAEAFGLSGCAYGELVGANMDRGLTSEHVAPGYPLKIAGLRVGHRLKIPEHWSTGSFGVAGGSVNPGQDNTLDPVNLAIAEQLNAITKAHPSGILIAEEDVLTYFNAISQWYRADMGPAAKVPGWNELLPYIVAARAWLQNGGAKAAKLDREQLAWSLYPWRVATPLLGWLHHKKIAWALVRDWANQYVKPGMVKSKPEPKLAGNAGLWAAQDFSQEPWTQVPWTLPWSQVPAWAFPWGYVIPKALKATPPTATPEQNAKALIADLAAALALPTGEAEPAVEADGPGLKTAPGGRPDPIYQRSGSKKPKPSTGAKEADKPPETKAGRSPLVYLGAGGAALALTYFGWRALKPRR